MEDTSIDVEISEGDQKSLVFTLMETRKKLGMDRIDGAVAETWNTAIDRQEKILDQLAETVKEKMDFEIIPKGNEPSQSVDIDIKKKEDSTMEGEASSKGGDLSVANTFSFGSTAAPMKIEEQKPLSIIDEIHKNATIERASEMKPRKFTGINKRLPVASHEEFESKNKQRKEIKKKMLYTTDENGVRRKLNPKIASDLSIMMKNIGAIIPHDIDPVEMLTKKLITNRDTLLPFKNKERLGSLRLLLSDKAEEDDNNLRDLKVEFQDYFAMLPLLNLPIIVSPLYLGLRSSPSAPIVDSFEVIAFYKKVITLMLIDETMVVSRKKDLVLMLVDTINKKNFDEFVKLIKEYAILKEGYDVQKDLDKLKEILEKSEHPIADGGMFLYEVIYPMISSVQRKDKFKDKLGSTAKLMQEMSLKWDSAFLSLWESEYTEDVLEFKDKLLEEWNETFFGNWDNFIKYLNENDTAGKEVSVNAARDFYYASTFDLMYIYEVIICKLLSLSQFMDVKETKALITLNIKPADSSVIQDEVLKEIVSTRMRIHKYRSIIAEYEFNEKDYVIDGKAFVSKVDVEMMKKFYALKVDNDEDLAKLVERRKLANDALSNVTQASERQTVSE